MKNQILIIIALSIVLFLNFDLSTMKITGRITSSDDGTPIPGVNVVIKGTSTGTVSDTNGFYSLTLTDVNSILVYSCVGYITKEVAVKRSRIDIQLDPDVQQLHELVVVGYGKNRKMANGRSFAANMAVNDQFYYEPGIIHNTEEYAPIHENIFHQTTKKPLSTFSIDVDAASYSNIRRFINYGQTPPKDAVRIEEMINYFTYEYPEPENEHPFSLISEVSECPWNQQHQLLHIGLQGKSIPQEELPPSNLVFLIDVSGSMNTPEKLPLLKSAYKMMVNQLNEKDKIAIVVYAGAAGCVLPSTTGNEKVQIINAIDRLQAGGSTAGNAGIQLAYQIARENFIEDGNNRVILATDGDFNVGISSTGELERIISEKKESGIFLTVLGFGMGNYKDSRMEVLADKGNGNYAYIDNISEARKVLVNQLAGTLYTIAKDVKIQIEFNPANVKGYRLIGYENRKLNDEDFHDDKKDAGELGAGHTVTALYEIIPFGTANSPYIKHVDELKYQKNIAGNNNKELVTLKLRYKDTEASESKLLEVIVPDEGKKPDETSDDFRFSAAVAAFGMLLRDSEFIEDFTYNDVSLLAKNAKGDDKEGYRKEFIQLVESMALVASK